MRNIKAFASARTASLREDDAGLAPIVLSLHGPKGGALGYFSFTLEEAQNLLVELTRAIEEAAR